MDDYETKRVREQFMQAPLATRLNGLAATLDRISASARHAADPAVVTDLLDEASQFIQWTVPETTPDVAAELTQIQRILSMWQKSWIRARRIPQQKTLLAVQTKNWSYKVAGFSRRQ